VDRTGGRTGQSPTPTRSGWRQRLRRRIGKKEATRHRWNGQRNWEEKKRMRCDYSILAESGWRERTPRKSWEGLKRAPHAPTSMIATRARVRAEEEGFGWGLKKGERLPQERRQVRDDDGGGNGNITFSQGLNCKTNFPHRQMLVGEERTRAHSRHGRWSYRFAPGRLVRSEAARSPLFWLFHTCPFPNVWILPGGFFASEASLSD